MKIIDNVSHLDHGLTPEHLAWLIERFVGRDAFFVETVELPLHLPALTCGVYGPNMGDQPVVEADVRYVVRGDRKWASRVLRHAAAPRPTRKLTVVAGPYGEVPCILYTSYGGPEAPREPGDTSIASLAEIHESRAFWKVHALSSPDTGPRV